MKECCQQLVRMDNVAATSAMGVNDPAPALACDSAAITPDQPAVLSLPATISQYFIGGMMPDSANPVQHSVTVIEIRPFKGGWQCFEAPGV
jgi:hypothetical protein